MASAVVEADRLAADVAARLAAGDPADEPLARLTGLVADVVRLAAADGSATAREAVAALAARLGTAVNAGDGWLSTAGGAELASLSARQRIMKAYRLPHG